MPRGVAVVLVRSEDPASDTALPSPYSWPERQPRQSPTGGRKHTALQHLRMQLGRKAISHHDIDRLGVANTADLSESELAAAERDWDDFWAATRPVELTATVEHHAGRLARTHALRAADAVHLASALAVSDHGLIVAVWDQRLHAGAQAAGCRVAPAQLDP